MIRCPKCHKISAQVYLNRITGYDPNLRMCICKECDYTYYQVITQPKIEQKVTAEDMELEHD